MGLMGQFDLERTNKMLAQFNPTCLIRRGRNMQPYWLIITVDVDTLTTQGIPLLI